MADLHNRLGAHFGECSGRCGDCKWWQTDPNAEAGHDRVGLCLHEELAHFELQVSADSGCNRFRPDERLVEAGQAAAHRQGT